MTGKRVILCTFGSLGDLYPLLSLAREMRDRGHSPVLATTSCYRNLVEAEDVAFHPVRPDIDVNDPAILRRVIDRRKGAAYIFDELVFPSLRASYEDTAAAATGADLIVTHPITLSAFLYARKTGLPWASVALAPVSLYSIHDPPVLSGIPFAERLAACGPSVQRVLLKAIAILFESHWKPFRALEKGLGLPPAPNPLIFGQSSDVVLGLFSPLLAAPQPDWPSNAHATGFPFFAQRQVNPPELQRFLDSGEPPIVFTLGSAAVGVAGDFYRESAAAAHALGRRAVLLVGRDPSNQPREPLPDGILAVPYAPHATVFPCARAIVHSGGIGTTGEAMRAGRPMLVVPYSHDQPDQAARLTRLGVARTLPPERYNARTAAREIHALLDDAAYAERAAGIGMRIRDEVGTATACDLLVRLLQKADSKSREHSSAAGESAD